MAQSQDVTLNGVSYTLVPGKYEKSGSAGGASPLPDLLVPTKSRRRLLGPFGPGMVGAFEAINAKGTAGWPGSAVGPVFGGFGVEPFPNSTSFDDSAILNSAPGIASTARMFGIVATDRAFIGLGRYIYKTVQLTNGTWAALTQHADLGVGAQITGLTYFLDDMLVALGNATDIRRVSATTGTVTVWRTGEQATHIQGYKGQALYAELAANTLEELRLSGTKWNGNAITHFRYLDAPIVRMALFKGKVAIATRATLWMMGGEPYPGEADDASVTADTSKAPAWLGDPEPIMTHGTFAAGDDFVFLASYRGRLYTWLGGQVAEFDDSQEEPRWVRVGPEGTACYGGCVAGDWLVLAIAGRYGDKEIWGFDGAGWWRMQADSTVHVWPVALAGAGNREFLIGRDGSETYDLFRTTWRSSSVHTYPASGEWRSALLDAEDPTRDKSFTALGAVFSAPAQRGNSGSADSVTVNLEYSTDGGATWTLAATTSSSAAGTLIRTLTATGLSITARALQLRVSWSSVSDWAPVLTEVWYEAESQHTSNRKRRWEIAVAARDRKPRRDGQLAGNDGRDDVAALWSAYAAGGTVAFQDLDFDGSPWGPEDLAPGVFLVADDILYKDGQAVDRWPDRSGNGKAAVNAVASERPVYKPAQVAYGGRAVVRFDGVDDDLGVSAAPMGQPFWLAMVVGINGGTTGTLFGNSAVSITARLAGAGGTDVLVSAGTNQTFAPDLVTNGPHVFFVQFDGANSYVAMDGTAEAALNVGANSSTAGTLRLMSLGSSAWTNGDLGCVVVGGGVLAAADRQRLEGWVAHEYGIEAKLAGGHPYLAAPPVKGTSGAYTVRIDAIEETAAKPNDAPRGAESIVALELVEV